jgi:hypothetical protein
MNFQLVNPSDQTVMDDFVSFCLKSKPYSFCCLPALSARIFQIKKYYECLFQDNEVYALKENGSVRFFIALKKQDNEAFADFVIGKPFLIFSDFANFRKFYSDLHNTPFTFRTLINRENKLEPYLKYIKKRDPDARFLLDNDKIFVLWYNKNGTQT